MSEDVQVRDDADLERYEILVDGEVVGYTAYARRDGRIDLLHTEIDPKFEGHGLASKLIAFSLDDARATHTPVMPYCPFVRSFVGKHPDYLDLVPEDQRGRFGLA